MAHGRQSKPFSATLLGTGGAYDINRHNSGLLISENGFSLLINCGPWLTMNYLRTLPDPNDIDAIYVTNAHPDQASGLTTLTSWMDSKGRSKNLIIYVQRKQKEVIEPLIKFAHWPKTSLVFEVAYRFIEDTNQIGFWAVDFAPTKHLVENMSICIHTGSGWSLFFTGNGEMSYEGALIAAKSDWVYADCECFHIHRSHSSLQRINKLHKKPGSYWGLYHVDPSERRAIARELLMQKHNIRMAEEGEEICS